MMTKSEHPGYKLVIHARKTGAEGLPTVRLIFYGTDHADAWQKWTDYNSDFRLDWMPPMRLAQ